MAKLMGPLFGAPMRGWLRRALLENAGLKLVSFLLSVTLFVVVRGEREAVVAVQVAVEYVDPPPGRVLVSDPIESVRVLVKGPWTRIKRFDERSVPPIEVSLGGLTAGEFAIQPDLVRLPPGLEVASVSPRSVRVVFDPVEERELPVRPRIVGTPAAGWELGEVTAAPSSLRVIGGTSVLAGLGGLELSAVSIEDRAGEVVEWARVVGLPGGVELVASPSVEVRVALVEASAEPQPGEPNRAEPKIGDLPAGRVKTAAP